MWTLVQSLHNENMVSPRKVLSLEDEQVLINGGILVSSFLEVQDLEFQINGTELFHQTHNLIFSNLEIGGQRLFVRMGSRLEA